MLRRFPPWVSYVVPFAVYLLLTAVEAHDKSHYPLFYSVKIFVTALLAFILRPVSATSSPAPAGKLWGWYVVAAVAGVVLNSLWFVIDGITPHPHWLTAIMGTRAAFNPYVQIADPVQRIAFLIVRFTGLVVLIPYIEERFYRDFILRYVANQDNFQSVAVGSTQPAAVIFSTLLFAASHPEWLSAAVFGLAMCVLVRLSKDIRVCMVAHSATNLALGVTVIVHHQWQYW